jgi:hypothetical protein
MNKFWNIWLQMWAQINSHWTTWFSYVLVVLGGVMTYWDSIDDYLPAKWRGLTYSIIGVIVLILRNRIEIQQTVAKLRSP